MYSLPKNPIGLLIVHFMLHRRKQAEKYIMKTHEK